MAKLCSLGPQGWRTLHIIMRNFRLDARVHCLAWPPGSWGVEGMKPLSPVPGRDHEERPLTPVQFQPQEKLFDITILQTHQELGPSFMLPYYPKGRHFKGNHHLSSHNKSLLTLFFLKQKKCSQFSPQLQLKWQAALQWQFIKGL